MTGYCPDCGNTLCICDLIESDKRERSHRRFMAGVLLGLLAWPAAFTVLWLCGSLKVRF